MRHVEDIAPVDEVDSLVRGMEPSERVELGRKLAEAFPEAFGGNLALNGETLALTPEEQEKVQAATTAMAEKFGLEEQDFVVVRTSRVSDPALTVVYAGEQSLNPENTKKNRDGFTWNSMFARGSRKRFIIEVLGRELDTRDGMTYDTYSALVAHAKAHGNPLPDRPLHHHGSMVDDWRTGTWLTGESSKSGAPHASVREDDRVSFNRSRRDNEYVDTGFRPAVVIQ